MREIDDGEFGDSMLPPTHPEKRKTMTRAERRAVIRHARHIAKQEES